MLFKDGPPFKADPEGEAAEGGGRRSSPFAFAGARPAVAMASFVVGTLFFLLVAAASYAGVRLWYRRRNLSSSVLSASASVEATRVTTTRALARAAQWTSGEEALVHVLVATAVVCCYMAWAIIYVAQSHPLVNPVLTEGQYVLYQYSRVH